MNSSKSRYKTNDITVQIIEIYLKLLIIENTIFKLFIETDKQVLYQ